MASEVLYRKWRSRTFAEVVGQEHVTTTLRQSVLQGRVAHAYLFSGPRGTGKTSTARILAKAVNCLSPKEGEPDNECRLCQAVNEGRLMDLIEVDAASNRGINEIRNIRDKVGFAPTEARFKVYIIDEAHMLTPEASNAFLKTLEEPPAHAIFVLCTTEPHKILPTILSRCQRFDFRRLSSEAISGRLEYICQQEGIEFEPEALRMLARAVTGSMRDGNNLLEQLVVSYGSPVTLAKVQELLGLGGTDDALSLVRYLLNRNLTEALTLITRAAWAGNDMRQLHRLTLGLLRGVLVYQCGAGDTLDQSAEVAQTLQGLAKTVPMEQVVTALRVMGEINARHDETATLPLELAAVEICTGVVATSPVQPAPSASMRPSVQQAPAKAATLRPTPAQALPPVAPADTTRRRPPEVLPPDTPPRVAPSRVAPSSPTDNALLPTGKREQMANIVNLLRRFKGKRFNVGSLLRDCRDFQVEDGSLSFVFAHLSNYERFVAEMEDPRSLNAVKEAVAKTLGSSYDIKPVLGESNGGNNNSSYRQSPMVRTALGLGAKIVEAKEPYDE